MRSLLLLTNRFLVHGFTSQSQNGTLLQRIDFTIKNNESHELCVCTVANGDHSRYNYFQPFGLIIGNSYEVTYCRYMDGGTSRMANGELNGITEGGFYNPTQVQIRDSILDRPSNTYNEFRIKKYEVAGFYISKDENELDPVSLIINNEALLYNQTSHYELPYYFVVNGFLKEVIFDSKSSLFCFVKEVSNTELYGNTFKKKVFEISIHSILVNLETYFKATKKEFYGVLFNPLTNNVVSLFGNTPKIVLEYIKNNTVNSKAGFKVDLHEQIPGLNSSDLLLISEELLSNSPIEIDTIIVHELTHFAIDSDNVNVELIVSDKELGRKFYKASGQYDYYETQHDEDFCNYLVGALRMFNEFTKSFKSDDEAAISGFRFELPDDFNEN